MHSLHKLGFGIAPLSSFTPGIVGCRRVAQKCTLDPSSHAPAHHHMHVTSPCMVRRNYPFGTGFGVEGVGYGCVIQLLCPTAVSCDTRITYPPGHAAGVSSALNPGTSLVYTSYESNTTRCRLDTIRPWSKRQSYKDRVLTVGHATTARWCHFPFPLLPFPSLVQEPLLTAIRNPRRPRRSRPCSFIRHASISSIETLRE